MGPPPTSKSGSNIPRPLPEVLSVLRQSADRVTLTGKDGVVVMVTLARGLAHRRGR